MEREEKDLTPERVVQILKKKGTHIDIEEAKIILEFINRIADIAVKQYLRGCL